MKILDVETVDESQLPAIMTNQFDKIEKLEKRVKMAMDMAVDAKDEAEKKKVSVGLFNKKNAIESLQDVVDGVVIAQMTMADAQTLLFEYQTKLTEVTKYLFGLGVSNLAMNRSVVRELELKLKGASDEEISELAKQELRNVIIQLKAQEDMMKKQEVLTGKVKEQAGHIKEMEEADEEQDEKIDELMQENDEQDEAISKNRERISMQQKVLEAQKKKDAEHDKKFEEMAEDDDKQDDLIKQNAIRIDELQKKVSKLEKVIIITTIIACSALVLALLSVVGVL